MKIFEDIRIYFKMKRGSIHLKIPRFYQFCHHGIP